MAYLPEDIELVLLLSGSDASLATSPGNKDNWVERAGPGGQGGNLPPYIRKIARGIMKSGKPKSMAIGMAIGTMKRWAAGGNKVHPDTRAKAAAALAQWEALRAKSAAHHLTKAVHLSGAPYLFLAQPGAEEYDVEIVRDAWSDLQQRLRDAANDKEEAGETPTEMATEAAAGGSDATGSEDDSDLPYFYIKSMWSTFLIVAAEGESVVMLKIPYDVVGGHVIFGSPEAVKTAYVPAENWDEAWDEGVVDPAEGSAGDLDVPLNENETALLNDMFRVGG